MRAIRVLHVTTDAKKIAGAERLLLDIAGHADRDQWQLGFATLSAPGVFSSELRAAGWPVFELGVERVWDLWGGLRRAEKVVREFRPDVIHAHLFHAAAFCGILGGRTGVPVFQTRHYSRYMARFPSSIGRYVDRWAARRSAAIAAVSGAARDHVVRDDGVDPAKVVVIENAVDVESLGAIDRERGRRALQDSGVRGASIILCAGSFHWRKGHEHLLEAFAVLSRENASAQLVLLGEGPLANELHGRCERLDIASSVHFLGHRSDANLLMAGADIYVQPSIEEGFGLALVEAMAMAVPVVASRVGGMVDTLRHEITGLHVPPGDKTALASAFHRLLVDSELARRLGRAAAKDVTERFALSRMIEEYDRWYRGELARLASNNC